MSSRLLVYVQQQASDCFVPQDDDHQSDVSMMMTMMMLLESLKFHRLTAWVSLLIGTSSIHLPNNSTHTHRHTHSHQIYSLFNRKKHSACQSLAWQTQARDKQAYLTLILGGYHFHRLLLLLQGTLVLITTATVCFFYYVIIKILAALIYLPVWQTRAPAAFLYHHHV